MKTISVKRFGGGRFAEEYCIETESAISMQITEMYWDDRKHPCDLDKPFRVEAHSCIACQYIMRGDPPACNALRTPAPDLYKENDCSDFEAHPIDA